MGMVTELERAIWAAAEPIRVTRFATILRNARMSKRDPSLPGPDDQTQDWELSFNPAIQRTLAATTAVAMERRQPPDTESEWFKWNLAAQRAVTRLAAKCWAGIDSQRRVIFTDEDNFQPIFGQTNLYELRSDSPGAHLAFEGLNAPDVRAALRAVYEAARATPAYENALKADRRLARSREKTIVWANLGRKGHQELEATATHGLTIQEGRERAIEIVKTSYAGSPVEEIAAAFRRYNRLVQHIIWSVLGLAEIAPGPFVLTSPVGTMRCTRDAEGSPFIRVTSAEATNVVLRLTYPVWIDTNTPLDGLHLLVGYTMTLSAGAASDVSLVPIRWSAGQWPA
jgi:hypothetical protein